MIVMRAAVTPLGIAALTPLPAVAPADRRHAAAPSRMRVPAQPVDDARAVRGVRVRSGWLDDLVQRYHRVAGTGGSVQSARVTNWGWPRRGDRRDNTNCSRDSTLARRPRSATRMSNSYLLFADTVIEDDGTLEVEVSAEPDSQTPDEWVRGWHDSSYDLKRGLMVIELDIDPVVTHGSLAAPKP
jgi:hypothetical protein